MIDLGVIASGFRPVQPAPTCGGVETGPGTSDQRPGPRSLDLDEFLDECAAYRRRTEDTVAEVARVIALSRRARGADLDEVA